MTILGIKREISGVSSEFTKLTGKKIDLENIINFKSLKNIKPTVENAFKGMHYDTSAIQEYVDKFGEITEQNPKMKLEDRVELVNNSVSSNSFGSSNTPQPKNEKVDVSPDSQSMSLWDMLKNKMSSVVPIIQQFKNRFKDMKPKTVEELETQITNIKDKLDQAKGGKIELDDAEVKKAEEELKRLIEELELVKKGGRQSLFSKTFSGIKSGFSALKNSKVQLQGLSGVAIKVKNSLSNMGSGMKKGLGHVLKYAGALFSIRSIYSILSSAAQGWLSSQNAGAQQLSANIDYMKYALGSALAPVIQFVTNLAYQLLKAIQSVAFALTGVNIFAKATAASMKSAAGSAKSAAKESKTLAGVHNEINNVNTNDNSGGGGGGGAAVPNIDLSDMDNTPNKIIDALKNGDWYSVGSMIGEKLNEALESIPWDKIQNGARNIAKNIALFLNGFIETTNWTLVGNTFAEGINTIFIFAESFIDTFNWAALGKAIADGLNGLFLGIDWNRRGRTVAKGINGVVQTIKSAVTGIKWVEITKSITQGFNTLFSEIDFKEMAFTLSEGLKGIFEGIGGFFQEIDWQTIVDGIVEFITTIDYSGISDAFFEMLGNAVASLLNLGMIIGQYINQAIDSAKQFFQNKIEECGGSVVDGIFKGIKEALANIGTWIMDHIFKPFMDGFKNVFGIHSPSTVMAEMGNFIIQGLLDGIIELVGRVGEIWNNLKKATIDKFNEIKQGISDIWNNVKTKTIEVWNNIKTKVKEGAQGAWTGITSIFSNIPSWFQEKFSSAWQKVKDVFSKGGKIFSGIKDGILDGLKSVINALIDGINQIIKVPFDGINSALNKIRNVGIGDAKPFSGLPTISVPQIPKLAKGNVAYEETLAIFGEYSGAKNDPEITSPKSIMYDTMRSAIEDSNKEPSPQSLKLIVKVSDQTLGEILIEDIRELKRQTGKDIEALTD